MHDICFFLPRFAWWPRRVSRTKVRNPRRGSFRNVTHKYFTHTKIRDFLSNHRDITALFVINNGLTVMEVALEMGYTIPQDLSIIMFDDYEFSHLLKVPPTCMRQQEKLLGQEAVKLIISTVENPLQKRQQIFVPPKLIIRNSTALYKAKTSQQVN
ncbi:hypothetical protein ABH20_12215 [Geobacillus sp. T6]|nr:hypothetical protein ABH20_12215 [Geobacillus sp. T6]